MSKFITDIYNNFLNKPGLHTAFNQKTVRGKKDTNLFASMCLILSLFIFSGCEDIFENIVSDEAGVNTSDSTIDSGETETNTSGSNTETADTDSVTEDGLVYTKTIEISGTPVSTEYWYLEPSAYGACPNICYCSNTDNSVDIAWLDTVNNTITVTSVDPSGNKTGEFTLSNIPVTHSLLDITKIPSDNSFVIGYSANFNEEAYADVEFWVTRVDKNGNEIFNVLKFGGAGYGTINEDVEPGAGGTSRISYSKENNNICLYLAHHRKWASGITHQAGWLGFINIDGSVIEKKYSWNGYFRPVGNDWFLSHNFDQRLLIDDNKYILLGHGDSSPRALVFSIWDMNMDEDTDNNLVYKSFFEISGEAGDNTTNTHLGGVVKLSNGNYGVCFSSAVLRNRYDVCYMVLNAEGTVLKEAWLTSNSNINAVYPRIANYGEAVLIAWEEIRDDAWELLADTNDITSTVSNAHFMTVDNDGNVIQQEIEEEGIRLQLQYDLINLPNGDIFWVEDTTENLLKLHWIKEESDF